MIVDADTIDLPDTRWIRIGGQGSAGPGEADGIAAALVCGPIILPWRQRPVAMDGSTLVAVRIVDGGRLIERHWFPHVARRFRNRFLGWANLDHCGGWTRRGPEGRPVGPTDAVVEVAARRKPLAAFWTVADPACAAQNAVVEASLAEARRLGLRVLRGLPCDNGPAWEGAVVLRDDAPLGRLFDLRAWAAEWRVLAAAGERIGLVPEGAGAVVADGIGRTALAVASETLSSAAARVLMREFDEACDCALRGLLYGFPVPSTADLVLFRPDPPLLVDPDAPLTAGLPP